MSDERPDIRLAIGYAQRGHEAAEALFALDRTLAAIVRRASDPLVGQMRLTWWREALAALDSAPPPAEPVLRALAERALAHGVRGADLAAISNGWEALLEEPFGDDAMTRHGDRGAALFAALAVVTGAADPPITNAGRGWALADLATHLGDPALAARAEALARPHLASALAHRWSRAGRPIGALTLLARLDLDRANPARRIARLVRHRLTGR